MKKKDNLGYYLSLITQVGLTIIASILVGLFLGMFLDEIFKTEGVFLMIFLLFGIIGGFLNAYKQILKK